MALHFINTDAVENEVGGLKGPLGAPMSPLCDSLKRQRTFSDISTEPPSSPTCSIMSPTSTNSSMSPTLGPMSPMMGMSSPTMGALPEGTEYHSEPFSLLCAAQEPMKVFYEPNDETPLMLSFMDFVPCSQEEEDEKSELQEKRTSDHDIVEKDGVTWEVTRGRPPTMSELEKQLLEVKFLYKTKYGEYVDDEDEEEEQVEVNEIQYVEKDGIKWEVTRGRPPTMSQLEDTLAEVKSLYKTKYGEDVDDDEEEQETDEHEIQYVYVDGVAWEVTRGRPPTTSKLETMLDEVKSLYKTKYGEDVDDEEDEEDVPSTVEA